MCLVICKPLVLTFGFIATKLSAWKHSISRVNVHVFCQGLLAGSWVFCWIWEFMAISPLRAVLAHLDKARGPPSLCLHLTSSDNSGWWELLHWVSLWFTNSLPCWAQLAGQQTASGLHEFSPRTVLLTPTSQDLALKMLTVPPTETAAPVWVASPLGPLPCLYVPFHLVLPRGRHFQAK